MTHVRPVHPATLEYLLGAAGFKEAETRFSSPVPAEIRLQKLTPSEVIDDERNAFIDSYNHNIDSLNGLLYGAQDYAIIGKK